MTSELLVCWIDPDYDRVNASDGVSRYGAYVRDYARLFDPFQDAPQGVTTDPVEFAIAAFRVVWPNIGHIDIGFPWIGSSGRIVRIASTS